MMCGRAGRPIVSLVRRSLITLQTSLNHPAANASNNAASTSDNAASTCPPKNVNNNCSSDPCAPKNPPQCCDTAFDFVGKTIVITGVGKGMGRATATALTACGAMVIGVDNNSSDLKCLADESCGRVIPVCVDLCDWDKTKEALSPHMCCPVDGLVNNAGILLKEPFLSMTKEGVQKQLLVNVVALLHVGMLCAQNMVKNKRKGSIVNLASIFSRKHFDNATAYCVTKGGVAQATRSMACELGCHGIRVNSVSPSIVMTDMGKKALDNGELSKRLIGRTPLGRNAEVCEVVDLILYLLGDRSTFISGANVPVDGGYWAA